MTLESSLERLEQIVAHLEQDDVPLDDALRLFEEGVEQLRVATSELARADAEVKRLEESADGVLGLVRERA